MGQASLGLATPRGLKLDSKKYAVAFLSYMNGFSLEPVCLSALLRVWNPEYGVLSYGRTGKMASLFSSPESTTEWIRIVLAPSASTPSTVYPEIPGSD
jgi:hypothetical protein